MRVQFDYDYERDRRWREGERGEGLNSALIPIKIRISTLNLSGHVLEWVMFYSGSACHTYAVCHKRYATYTMWGKGCGGEGRGGGVKWILCFVSVQKGWKLFYVVLLVTEKKCKQNMRISVCHACHCVVSTQYKRKQWHRSTHLGTLYM